MTVNVDKTTVSSRDGKEEKANKNRKKPNPKEPYGHCLLARDTPQNRKLFPDGPFGKEVVQASICGDHDDVGDDNDDSCTHYHYTRNDEDVDNAPIHILIASFRDILCGRTIHNAISRAKNPHRLFFRVIQQTQPDSGLDDDIGCWERYCEKYNPHCDEYKNQVRIIPVDSSQSLGPTWARSRLSAMMEWDFVHRNQPTELDFVPVALQDFCMQIDSHMDFSDNFDVELIETFHMTQNDYAVLSTYVTDIAENNKDPKNVPNLCMVIFTSSIRNWGTKECVNLIKPKLTNAMWGAGLSFHKCHAEINVPVDPYLDNVFDGEEGSRGIRFFTHGYDVYTPHRVLVTHDYHGHQSNPVVHSWGHKKEKMIVQESHWKWMDEIEQARSGVTIFGSNRVNLLLGIGSEKANLKDETALIRHSRYGLGTKRTLDQAIEFTGINLRQQKMDTNRCGNLQWVPFDESDNYGIEELLSRGRAGESVMPFVLDGDAVLETASITEKAEHATPRRIRFVEGGEEVRKQLSQSQTATLDFYLVCGLVCAVLALAVRVSTRKRPKNDKHKN